MIWDAAVSAVAGGTHDVGVQLELTVSAGRTTCDAAVYAGRESWRTTFYFDFQNDGTAIMFDMDDVEVGAGYYTESVMVGATVSGCEFPPSL